MPDTFWARTDSPSANNAELNLTGADAVQITFIPSGVNGDTFLDFVDTNSDGIAEPDGNTLVTINTGTVTGTYSFILRVTRKPNLMA
jgi:hypothetical protein